MNKDEVLKVARECGMEFDESDGFLWAESVGLGILERFAAAMYDKGEEDMRERMQRKNPSGCICKMDDETGEVLSPCNAHKEWAESLPITQTNTEGEQDADV